MLEDNRLKVFKAVAEEGNFTRAARSLGITQPAVSQCIAELERETGTVLVERSRTVVRLTTEGETFLRYAELVLRDYGALNAVCGAGGRLAPGKRVTVSAPSFVQEYILPDLLSDIRTAAAAVFDLRENAGESDIVFSLAPVSGTLDFEGGAALVGGITAVAVRSGAPSASPDLLVWAPYRPLLTPEEAARVSFSSDSIGTLLAVLRRSPGSVAFLPLLSVPEGMPILPDPLSRLYLELRLRMQEGFSRSRLGVFFGERLAAALKNTL